MEIRTVGIHSPGSMGAAIGAVLARHGIRPVAALDSRSERTRALAAEAGIEDVGNLEHLVREADALLSVLVPDAAVAAAEAVAAALRATGTHVLYADCNAIAPQTARRVGEVIAAAGSTCVDASIIGPPPRRPGVTRIYASGPEAATFGTLAGHGLDVRPLGEAIGLASGIKLCYAAMTKGLTALAAEQWIAARRLGVEEALRAELETSQGALLAWMERVLPRMPPKAHRFVGEMEEHALGFAGLGLPPGMMEGAAELYRLVADSPAGRESPEQADPARPLAEVVARLAEEG